MAQQCTATSKSTGEQCARKAIEGGKTCRVHGSGTKAAKAAAAARIEREQAERVVATLGLPRTVTPADALLEEVHRTAGHVAWLAEKVKALDDQALVWGTTREKSGGEDYGTTQEAKPSVWYELYDRERTKLVTVCTAALKAGIDERRVRLAEQQGELLAGVIRAVLADLDLTAEQQAKVGEVVPRHLRSVTGGAA